MTCERGALVVGVAAMLAAGTAFADADGWSEVMVRDGVRVSLRPFAGSAISELQAVSEFDAPAERLLAVLDDIDRYPQFMPPTSMARLLKREGNQAYYYMEINPPVISRRDYCIRVGWEHLDGGKLRSWWMADNSECIPERSGVVRVRQNAGEWVLTPIDDGRRTHVVYHCHIEVGGHVPAWMINRVSAKEMPTVFTAVRRAVILPRYAAVCTSPSCAK